MTDAPRCRTCDRAIPPDAPSGLCPECMLRDGLGDPSDEASDRPLAPDELSRLLPHLEVREIIGQGGMGVVYRARQPALDRTVALKVLPSRVAREPGFADRFRREAKAMARLAHPNIVAVHEAGEVADTVYLVMEMVGGVNLRQAQASGKLTPAEALAIVPQICDALQYAHDQGVVHRDVKPENILLDRHGRVKITDFGLAKLVSPGSEDVSLTAADQVMGTYHYMAPEQIRSPRDVDHRADIYSLGVVFYEMLTGDLPVGHFPPPSRSAAVDAALDGVVMRALERERDRRWQRADEVKTGVEAARSGAPVESQPEPDSSATRSTRRRPSAAAVIGFLGVPLALGLLFARIDMEWLGAILFMGFMFSGVAWWQTHRRPERFGMLWLSVAGVFMPIGLAAVLGALTLFGSQLEDADAVRGRTTDRDGVPAPPADRGAGKLPESPLGVGAPRPATKAEFAAVRDLVARLAETVGGMADVDSLLELVDPKQRDRLQEITSDEWRLMAEEGTGGLPYVNVEDLPGRLRELELLRVEVAGDDGQAVLFAHGQGIRFPIVRRGGRWYFAIGPVKRLP